MNAGVLNAIADVLLGANRDFYGRPVRNAQILDESPRPVGTAGGAAPPDVATTWRDMLMKFAK